MATVQSMLKEKGKNIYSVSPESTILDCLNLMAEKEIGSVLVMREDRIIGIFSERDYARRGILKGNDANTPVSSVMTASVWLVKPDCSAETCMALMTEKHIRHLPVIDGGKVIGVISIGDVVKSMLSDDQAMIHGMENFLQIGEIPL